MLYIYIYILTKNKIVTSWIFFFSWVYTRLNKPWEHFKIKGISTVLRPHTNIMYPGQKSASSFYMLQFYLPSANIYIYTHRSNRVATNILLLTALILLPTLYKLG